MLCSHHMGTGVSVRIGTGCLSAPHSRAGNQHGSPQTHVVPSNLVKTLYLDQHYVLLYNVIGTQGKRALTILVAMFYFFFDSA